MSGENYSKALESFDKAMKIPGYEEHETAVAQKNIAKLKKQTQLKLDRKKFDLWMSEGRSALDRKDWAAAKKAFLNASTVSGYTDDSNALSGLNTASDELQLQQSEIAWNKVYDEADEHYQRGKLLDKEDPNAYKECQLTIKIITDFTVSAYYRDVTDVNKQRLTELARRAHEYMKTICLGSTKPTSITTSAPVQGQKWIVSGLEMPFIYIAPGTFQMGSNRDDKAERPVHKVTISKGYWIGKYEVTQDEYHAIMGSNPSNFKDNNKPVDQVNWNDAVSFCQKLTERERGAGRLPDNYEYRLPTEAEWEFAARGGNASEYYQYSGSNTLDSVAWYNSARTSEVGLKSPNELGIYDMSGNVSEWCLDDWHDNYDGAPNDGIRWGDGSGSNRVIRGGNWYAVASYSRVTNRDCFSSVRRNSIMGFRVVFASSSK